MNFQWKKIFNPIILVVLLIIISAIVLLSKSNSTTVVEQPTIPPLNKDCANSLVWSPLCFVIYVTNLDIDWNLIQPGTQNVPGGFYLQTFELIKNTITKSKYTPKDLLSTFKTMEVAFFQSELEKNATFRDKIVGTMLSSIDTWSDEIKLYVIIQSLSLMKIVSKDFIKNINQNFIDCMNNVFKKYKGPKAYYENGDKDKTSLLDCFKTIFPTIKN